MFEKSCSNIFRVWRERKVVGLLFKVLFRIFWFQLILYQKFVQNECLKQLSWFLAYFFSIFSQGLIWKISWFLANLFLFFLFIWTIFYLFHDFFHLGLIWLILRFLTSGIKLKVWLIFIFYSLFTCSHSFFLLF